MISKRELSKRLRDSTDESFSAPSSTLMDRLPDLAKASAQAPRPVGARAGRRFAAAVASVGLLGWLSMGSAGALVTVAAVGELPDPVQQFVADVVLVVGIDLPDPEEERSVTDGESGTTDGGVDGGSSSSTDGAGSNGQGSSSNGSSESGSSGNSGNAPGQGGSSPGNSGNAPGQSGSPGNSGNAPGRSAQK